MDNKVDMNVFLKPGAKILSDRDEGIKARKKADLETLDNNSQKVILVVPRKVMWNITPSFFGGMFEGSIAKYRDKFWDYYSFVYSDGSPIEEDLQERINYNYSYILERLD